MVEGPSKDTDWSGKRASKAWRPKSTAKSTSPNSTASTTPQQLPAPGTMATVEITESHDYDLIARAIEWEPVRTVDPAKIAAAATSAPAKNLLPILA